VIFVPAVATHCQRPAFLIQVSVNRYWPLMSLPLYWSLPRKLVFAIRFPSRRAISGALAPAGSFSL
jgi:hypothetical protein